LPDIKKPMRHITLLSVACPVLQYFFTLSKKYHDFRNNILNITFVLGCFLQNVLNISKYKENSATYYKNVRGPSRKMTVILIRC